MTTVNIKFQEIEHRHEALFPELMEGATEIIKGDHLNFGILEGGMESGKTSVAFVFRHETQVYIIETSATNFEVMYKVFCEFQGRIEEKRASNN